MELLLYWMNYDFTELWLYWTVTLRLYCTLRSCDFAELLLGMEVLLYGTVTLRNCSFTELLLDGTVTLLNCYFTELLLILTEFLALLKVRNSEVSHPNFLWWKENIINI